MAAFLDATVGTYFGVTEHRVSNFQITFSSSNVAIVRCMLDNPMYLKFFPVWPIVVVKGYYNFELEKSLDSGEWRGRALSEEINIQGPIGLVVGIIVIIFIRWVVL